MQWQVLIFTIISTLAVDAYKPKECTFPFHYKGLEFNDCTDISSDYLWCSPTKEYNGQSISCSSTEETQRLKRDNYYKLFQILKDTDSQLKALENTTTNGHQCTNCSAQVNIIITSLGALSNIASDHLRKITALKNKFNEKQRYADALLKKSEEINTMALKANRRRNEDVWYGTTPFCSGTCPVGQVLLKKDGKGDGYACVFGWKVLCRRVYYV